MKERCVDSPGAPGRSYIIGRVGHSHREEGHMKHPKHLVLLLAMSFILCGCALFIPWECRYLKAVQGRATLTEVQQKLGTLAKVDGPNGMTWLYEVREEQPSHRGTPTGFWCDEYRLAFDEKGVLQDWTHRSFFHKGELQPEPCQAGYERLAL